MIIKNINIMNKKSKILNFDNYFKLYEKLINNEDNKSKINKIIYKFKSLKKNKGKLILIGNGGSAASASHLMVDFTKNAKIKAINFNETSLITAFANDYGYENFLVNALKFYSKKKDIVIFMSVSGNSPNLINALKYCKSKKLDTITFSGSKKNNYLFKNGGINIYINSMAYNIVECIHLMLLTFVVDSLKGKAIYKVK